MPTTMPVPTCDYIISIILTPHSNECPKFRTARTGGRVDSARTMVFGFGRSASSKATWAARHNTLTNVAGQTFIKVNESDINGPRNGITQKTNAKGGIDRNYYDGPDGGRSAITATVTK